MTKTEAESIARTETEVARIEALSDKVPTLNQAADEAREMLDSGDWLMTSWQVNRLENIVEFARAFEYGDDRVLENIFGVYPDGNY